MIAAQAADRTALADVVSSMTYRKTLAGYAELQRRASSGIPLRTRWTLVMIDGKAPADTMIARLGGVGMDAAMFDHLLALGLIEPVPHQPPALADDVRPWQPHAAVETGRAVAPPTTIPLPAAIPLPTSATPTAGDARLDGIQRMTELYAFFCATIRDLIGLRGMLLQLAVESADTVDDYRALRDRYLAAVARSKGAAVCEALRVRLDALLG